jgi:hypothetical protein
MRGALKLRPVADVHTSRGCESGVSIHVTGVRRLLGYALIAASLLAGCAARRAHPLAVAPADELIGAYREQLSVWLYPEELKALDALARRGATRLDRLALMPLLADRVARGFLALSLEATGAPDIAEKLRRLPPFSSKRSAAAARPVVCAAAAAARRRDRGGVPTQSAAYAGRIACRLTAAAARGEPADEWALHRAGAAAYSAILAGNDRALITRLAVSLAFVIVDETRVIAPP